MTLPDTIDPRDVFYTILGIAFLGLTLQPWLGRSRLVNMPAIYVAAGALLGWLGLPTVDPLAGGIQLLVVEHASELIVIVSLAGVGLAIDVRHTWANWQPVVRLLVVAMPLTIVGIAAMGVWWTGLPLAAALLLAAALAPTDPVLAQAVQVGPPGTDETPMQIALTGEAGLNDGLAFPFVHLAIAVAASGLAIGEWGWQWLSFDLAYRVGAGLVVGYLIGYAISRLIFAIGDGRFGVGWNATLTVLGGTFLAYGATEAVDGYGFLAVFVAARAGRDRSRGTEDEGYQKFVHHAAEQIESILLAILLLWFGTFLTSGAMQELRWSEVGLALALLLALRPAVGWIALRGYTCPRPQARRIAFFGVRGMGSIFYLAYGQGHGDFEAMDAVWRITAVTIALSVLIHGFAANVLVKGDSGAGEVHPRKAEEEVSG